MDARLTAAGLDVSTSAVRAWVADLEGALLAEATVNLPMLRPARDAVELDPRACEQACRAALTQVVAGRPVDQLLGVTVRTPRRGFVLLDAGGEVLGLGMLDARHRGGSVLPRLLAVRAEEPDRWAATARVLSLHDWLLWRMAGVQVTEVSYACGTGLGDVKARGWDRDLLASHGLDAGLFAPVVEAGALVGELGEGWGLPQWLPVVAGCGDVQLEVTGLGALADGVLTIGATGAPGAQLASAVPAGGPAVRVSTHAARGLWLLETDTEGAGLQAVLRAVARLEQALGRPAEAIVVRGSRLEAQAVSQALRREVHVTSGAGAVPAAGAALVGRAVGAHAHLPALPKTLLDSTSGH